MMRSILGAAVIAAWCAAAQPARAQRAGAGQAGLRARMDEFIRSLPEDRSSDDTRRFFPTSGDWSYTHTVHTADGGTRIQRWIFPAAETSQLFGFDKHPRVNPVWDSFELDYHGQPIGLLIEVIMDASSDRWRMVGHNRFVPPGAPASSPVFVEWRREPRGWVIAAFGDERGCGRPLPGYERGSIVRLGAISAPVRPAYAAEKPWYVNHDQLRLYGYPYWQYSQPLALQPSELEPFGWKDDVAVYVEKGMNAEAPGILYVPTAPDVYQPYQLLGFGPDPYCK